MSSNTKFAAFALAGSLLVGSLVATGVNAQPVTPFGPGAGPGIGMMGGGFGPGPRVGAPGAGVGHEAIADALGVTSQELWDARAAGKSVADLAKDRNVDLARVVDAALAAHSAQIAAAVKAGTLTQAQADAMTALMRSHITSQFQATIAVGPMGNSMMGGHGMMRRGSGPGFGPRGFGTTP
jgi:hypothetical protein